MSSPEKSDGDYDLKLCLKFTSEAKLSSFFIKILFLLLEAKTSCIFLGLSTVTNIRFLAVAKYDSAATILCDFVELLNCSSYFW